ncbi:MAG: DinB family protein [Acidobacteria bacterium]|nr:DinB family protein [Acidobacteriota bacterium]
MTRPEKNEYDQYYERYVLLIPDGDIVSILAAQPTEMQDLFIGVDEAKGTFAYAEGKWTVKECLSHLIDGERIFAYRALRISRGDETPIEGFEQDGYIENSFANDRSFAELLDEFNLSRRANLLMFKNMRDEGWQRSGTASGVTVSVRGLAYIMAGHVRHHQNILKDKYLIK